MQETVEICVGSLSQLCLMLACRVEVREKFRQTLMPEAELGVEAE